MTKKIAVVGVGLMGSSLARHLVSAGYPVIVHDLDPATIIDFYRDLANIRS